MATAELKAFTTGSFYLIGGVATALTTRAAWHDPAPRTVVLLVLAAIAVGCGAGLLRWGRHLPQWSFHAVVGSGSSMLAAAVVLSADDVVATAVAGLFVFCAVDILYFFSGARALLQTGLLLLAVAVSLGLRGTDPGAVAALVLAQVAVVIVIGRLVARAEQGALDSLTGLPNRRGFDERLDQAVATARRTGAPLAVALVDVDHFKEVNDRGGHHAGDALLRRLVASWLAVLPTGILLTRQGGDEFALLAPGSSAEQLRRSCERLLEVSAPSAVSAGVADLGEGEDGASLARRADSALYAAKAAGRARTCVADPSDEALGADLAAAVAAGAVEVFLQPVVTPATGEPVAVEALARWRHPQRGWVSPATFIPLAERTAQVGALGRLVLERACRDALHLSAGLDRDLLLTVNTSGQQLVAVDFVEDLTAVLRRTGWPAHRLVVEVTESTVEIASTAALDALQRLRDVGVAVAIDDFGTGYSAFSHLDTLPADYLKLDAAFTAGTTTSPRRAAMLRALLDLCAQLGITVVAEGVETVEQAELLDALGCPLAQGYYYARPAPVHEHLERVVPASGGAGSSAPGRHPEGTTERAQVL
ncbi:putative bifunctional diguanylate cyclase/phosphodiesterase [Kineococcus sp. SYSU DK004]|uniref:putative bifunctional diguanylate cyclase/phosphodiesterase n=1 Tax=Kineococcus sp. SYSU DK004 TaxID=3383125 RepID=UPI003D7E5C2F